MARGKGKLSVVLAKQLNRDKIEADKRKKVENRQKNFELKPKPKNVQIHKPLIPFNLNDRIMLIGEGDFSYAISIINQNMIKPENLIATSFDSYDEVCKKYSTSKENIELLLSLGVIIYHEIDATNLSKSLGIQGGNKRQGNGSGKTIEVLGSLKLNNIIFNFPHVGKGIKDISRNIKANQQLLFEFFKSCRILFDILHFQKDKTIGRSNLSSMSVDEAEWNYLHQSHEIKIEEEDKEVITVTLFQGEPYDSWMIKKIARDSIGYQVQRSSQFDWDTFKGYEHKRTVGMGDTKKVYNERLARIYKFEKFKGEIKTNKKSGNDSDSD